MAPRKSLADRAADLDKPVKDYDPENEAPDEDTEENDSEDAHDEERIVTDHYEAVGKSKLRQKQAVSLGPKYRGSVVSRGALEASDDDEEEESGNEDDDGSSAYDDPEEADLERDHDDEDVEIDSDEAFGESDQDLLDKFSFVGSLKNKPQINGKGKAKEQTTRGKRPVAADFYSDSEDAGSWPDDIASSGDEDEEDTEMLEDEGSENEDQSELDEDDGDEDENEEDDDSDDSEGNDDGDAQRSELRKLMGESEKNIATTVGQAVRADAEKGVAVRQQRRAFDSILNLRIRLQKALVAVNTFASVEANQDTDTEPYQAAEEAAMKLWNSLDDFREALVPESKNRTGEKRKRGLSTEASNQEIWDSMVLAEQRAMPYRRKVLEKWSSRVKNSNLSATTRKLKTTTTQSLLSVLDDQLLNPDRLVKRARTPRSCAPVQAAKKVEEDANIYDDADFYQLLLKELVEQRSTDTTAPGAAVTTVRWAAIKEAKTRKQVDRRASKGRKLRFTVHEKLQNFMAPEDRRTWEADAIERFVGTLFGQKLDLKDDEDEEMGGAKLAGEGELQLFQPRSGL